DEIQTALYLFRDVVLQLLRERGLSAEQILVMSDTVADTLRVSLTNLSRQFELVIEKRMLSRYFAPGLVDRLLESRMNWRPKSSKLTVFFSDIRGFTRLSQQLDREEVIEILNSYFHRMTEIVYEFGGTIDKFIGDALMVFFGDPEPLPVEEQA